MEEPCCALGEELVKKENILLESKNFFVVPALGSMGIEGYLLLCSKKHYQGVGDIPAPLEKELEKILERVKIKLTKFYKTEVVVFEHGPRLGCFKGGGCLDHAHFHLVPLEVDIIRYLKKFFKLREIRAFAPLRKINRKAKSSYFFVEAPVGKRYVAEVNSPLPAQYLRRVIASLAGKSDWDWKKFPDTAIFIKAVKNFKKKL